MKKAYIAPFMKQEQAECCTMMAVSGINSNNGIGYGGIDKYGDQEPSVKEFLWDDDPE